MTRRTFQCICLHLFAALGVTVGQPETKSVDGLALPESQLPGLQEAFSTALRNAPRLLNAVDETNYARENRAYYSSSLYPKIGGVVNWNYLNEQRSDGTNTQNDKLYYNLSLTQPLFHWGALKANSRLGKLGYESAKLRLQDASRALANDVRGTYLSLITRKLALRNARFELARSEKAYAMIQERVKQNLAPRTEESFARMQLAEQRIALDRTELDYRTTRESFARMIGLGDFPDEQVPMAVTEAPAVASQARDLSDRWLNGGYMQSVSVRLNELELAREKLNYAIVATNLRPKFNLAAGMYQDRTSYEANAPTVNSTYMGLSLNWNLFDGLGTRGQKRASLARQRLLERLADSAAADAKASVRRAAEELQLSERSLALAEERWRNSQGGVAQTEADLAKGLVPPDAVEAARSVYYTAEVGIVQARVGYWMACAQFLSLVGADPVAERLANISSR